MGRLMYFAVSLQHPGFVLCDEICTALTASKCAANQRTLNQKMIEHKLRSGVNWQGR